MAGNCTCRDCPIKEITSGGSHRTAAGVDSLDCSLVEALDSLELAVGILVVASALDTDVEERSPAADPDSRRSWFPE